MNFLDWYKSKNGERIEIDWANRNIRIFDSSNELIDSCKISKNIDEKLNNDVLLKPSQKGEAGYMVFLNGFGGHNWLHEKIHLDSFSI